MIIQWCIWYNFITQREREFTFGICCRPYVCLLYIVCRHSVVCNVRAPYPAGWNFRQCLYATWYLGHPSTLLENFTEIVPWEPFRRELNKYARGVTKYSDFRHTAISRKRYKIEGKSVLITNRKSYVSFRLVPKSVTLNDLERRNGRYVTLFHRIR